MFGSWKSKLLLLLLLLVVYMGFSTVGIQRTDKFFRTDKPGLSMTPRVCYWLADIAYMTLRYDLAIQLTDRNIKDFPYNSQRPTAELRRAVCYQKVGDYSKAIQLFEDFLLDHPKDRRYHWVQDRIAKIKIMKEG